eukprot:363079-Chlamydomonas_euryale.AAC.6
MQRVANGAKTGWHIKRRVVYSAVCSGRAAAAAAFSCDGESLEYREHGIPFFKFPSVPVLEEKPQARRSGSRASAAAAAMRVRQRLDNGRCRRTAAAHHAVRIRAGRQLQRAAALPVPQPPTVPIRGPARASSFPSRKTP